MLYFTSDLHLCHKNIIKYARPQFEFSDEGLQQCEDLMLKNYNDVITDDDIVVFLGDIAFLKSEFKPHISEYCKKLKGRKLMHRGNHDTITDKFFLSCGFEKIIDYILFENIFICELLNYIYKLAFLDVRKAINHFKASIFKEKRN